MFKREYYYLVAGLPDLTLEKGLKKFELQMLVDEVRGYVSKRDFNVVQELFLSYDFLNIHNILQKREDLCSEKGHLGIEFLKEYIAHQHEEMEVPQYLKDLIRRFQLGQGSTDCSNDYQSMIRYTWLRFYQEIKENSTNRFIQSWFHFDRILRNIRTAWMCRKQEQSMSEQLVGLNEEIDLFVKNKLPDFGLRREFPLGEQIFNLLEEPIDLLECEFRFDQIRWQMADELTTFHYFDIDKILAFLAKADILDRWLKLDQTRGVELFNNLVKTLVEQKK